MGSSLKVRIEERSRTILPRNYMYKMKNIKTFIEKLIKIQPSSQIKPKNKPLFLITTTITLGVISGGDAGEIPGERG